MRCGSRVNAMTDSQIEQARTHRRMLTKHRLENMLIGSKAILFLVLALTALRSTNAVITIAMWTLFR